MRKIFIAGMALLLPFGCSEDNAAPSRLELISALPLNITEPTEPSGLTMLDDKLLTVSDDHDSTIFEVVVDGEQTRLQPFLKFAAPALPGVEKFDFEGITVDDKGMLVLVSERGHRLLRINPETSEAVWQGSDFGEAARAAGMFRKQNGCSEGLTFLGDGTFVIAAERQPRGLLRVHLNGKSDAVLAVKHAVSPLHYVEPRGPDYSGMAYADGSLYVLERGASVVTEVVLNSDGIKEKNFYSYAHVEEDEALAYADMTYGHAEGLYVDSDRIYIIVDNNGDHRAAHPEDRRPLLFIFKRPAKI